MRRQFARKMFTHEPRGERRHGARDVMGRETSGGERRHDLRPWQSERQSEYDAADFAAYDGGAPRA